MAYVSVDELFDGRSGKPFDAGGSREYTRKFRVVVDDKNLGPVAVCYAPGIPRPYTPYLSSNGREYDLLALMTGVSADQDSNDWSTWNVTCSYSTQMPESFGGPLDPGEAGDPSVPTGAANNPEMERPTIEWDFEVVQHTPAKDLDGKAFLNSASQPFTPPPSFEFAHAVLLITRNEIDFNRDRATKYAFALNSDTFLGAIPETVQCMPPKAVQQYRGSLPFWRVSYRLRFLTLERGQVATWQPVVLDAGMMKTQTNPLAPHLNTPVPIFKNGVAISQPVLLNGEGGEAAPDANGKLLPTYLNYRLRRKLSFSDLLSRGMS